MKNIESQNDDEEQLQSIIYGDNSILYSLILGCPFNLECKECPILEIREIPIFERIEFIEKLNHSERVQLVSSHFKNFHKNHKPGF